MAGGTGGTGGTGRAAGAGTAAGRGTADAAAAAGGTGGAGGADGGGGAGRNASETVMFTSTGTQLSRVGVKRHSRTAAAADSSKSVLVAEMVSVVRTAPFTSMTARSSTLPCVLVPRIACG